MMHVVGAAAVGVEVDQADEQREVREAVEHRVPEAAERASPGCAPCATLPSMKSKMLATIMTNAGGTELPEAERPGRGDVDEHADEREHVRVRCAARRRAQMMPRSGKHADRPDEPGEGAVRGSGRASRRDGRRCAGFVIIGGWQAAHKAHHSSPCPSTISRARSPGCPEQPGVYLFFNGRARRSTSARPARCATASAATSARAGTQPQDRRAARRGGRPRGHRHRLGRRGAGAREQPHQAADAQVQHPAARRQELSLPAADDDRGVSARAGGAARRARTATSTPARSCRRSLARRTMSLTHRLFGIRSCNEVITGQRGRPCLEYDIKRCLAPCVDALCSPEQYARAVERHAAVPRGAERRTGRRPARADDRGRGGRSASRRRRSCATRCADGADAARPPAEDGDGRARRPRRVRHEDRAGRRRRSRCSRCAAAASSSASSCRPTRTPAPSRPMPRARCCRPPSSSSTRTARCRPEIHVPGRAAPKREALEAWLSARAGRRVRLVVPQRGEKRGLLDLADRNAALAYQTRFNEEHGGAATTALETLRAVLALPALAAPDRVLRHLDASRAARRSRRWSSARTAG